MKKNCVPECLFIRKKGQSLIDFLLQFNCMGESLPLHVGEGKVMVRLSTLKSASLPSNEV